MRKEMVLSLQDADDMSLVGGKAATLGEMIRAGFNVPDGFVVTVSAFNKNMDKVLERKILKYFEELNSISVAVRSSAAAEDSKQATWAGQFETFLNTNRAHLINSIKKCWESASSERAVAYAKEKNLKSGPVAVVVQQMIHGDVSGVAFSVHPVTKNPEHMVIEAVWGLADSLVSGKDTPDTYIVHKYSKRVLEQHLSDIEAKLSAKQLKELVDTVTRIEAHFNFPVDIEWTFAKDDLFILQSRPITALS